MPKAKYTPEERKKIKAENLRKNREAAKARGYTQKSAAREEAIKEGKKTYTSLNACKKCGSYERYVSNYTCAPCTIESGLEKLNNEELMKPYRTKEKVKKRLDIWREKNPEKYQEQYKNDIAKQKCKEYYHNNKDSVKNSYLKTNYGITLEDYNFLLEKQNEKCKICNNECPTGKSLAVDHNHETGKVRGLLCKNCNIGLGMFFDNIDFLESAVLYLKSS
jgi:DNA-binding transcriptional MerR regulator